MTCNRICDKLQASLLLRQFRHTKKLSPSFYYELFKTIKVSTVLKNTVIPLTLYM